MDFFTPVSGATSRASSASEVVPSLVTRRPLSPAPTAALLKSQQSRTNILTPPASSPRVEGLGSDPSTAAKARSSIASSSLAYRAKALPQKRLAGSSSGVFATPKRRKIIVDALTPPRTSGSSTSRASGTQMSSGNRVKKPSTKRPVRVARSSEGMQTPSSPLTRRDDHPLPSSPFASSIAPPSSPLRSRCAESKRGRAISTESLPLHVSFDGSFILVIGRSRHISVGQQPLVTTPLPESLTSKLTPSFDMPIRFSALPRGAAHASRHHVALEYIGKDDTVKLVVLGQNGCKVRVIAGDDSDRTAAKRYGQHRVAVLRKPSGSEAGAPVIIEVDFYSCTVCLPWPSTASNGAREYLSVNRANTVVPSPLSSPTMADRLSYAVRSSSVTVPFSSPLLGGAARLSHPLDASSDLSSEEDEEEPVQFKALLTAQSDVKRSRPRSKSRSSSLSLPDEDDVDMSEEEEPFLDRESQISVSPSAQHQRVSSIHSVKVEEACLTSTPPPSDVDLVALISNTLVFSGHSATALPDLVKSILETQPSLKEHGSDQVWSAWVKQVLYSHRMFGRIDRKGKDASGKPLLPLFFYVPAEDDDKQRAAELGSLVRPLRGVQQRGGQAIDWRPVGKSKRG